ncbi:hypothetical protein [Rubrolithibacter danxiaensis]|uniref:hypothetical protein n=1 Tax=Rubrolithibacter danxiaensis TaxID=3390805 RepID=UPI003BF90E22
MSDGAIGAISGGASSLIGLGVGLFQRAKARRLEKKTVRPVYSTPAEVALNQKIAEKRAAQGMGTQQYANAQNNINRNVSAGLNALSTQRNGLAAVGNIVAQANDASLNLDAQDAQMQQANEAQLLAQNQNVADYKDKEFQYNKADKYAEAMNKIAQLRGAGNASLNNGVNNLSNIGMAMYQNATPKTPKASKRYNPTL